MNNIEKRITDLELKAEGRCPICKRVIKGWEPLFGYFSPEWWESMRERGVDPGSGHSASCSNKNLKIS